VNMEGTGSDDCDRVHSMRAQLVFCAVHGSDGWVLLVQTDVAIVAERQRMMEEWKEWYDTKREWLEWHTQGLQQLLGDRQDQGGFKLEEVETEMTISTAEEVIKP
jgi:hypothetical protein